MKDETKQLLEMTSGTLGKTLLAQLVSHIRLLPDVWQKMSKAKQDDVIDSLRKSVDESVRLAVRTIHSRGQVVVAGDLKQIAIKDGVQATVSFSKVAPNLHEIYDAVSKPVLLVVADAASFLGDMDSVRGESDQRSLNLGKEYDPNGDGKGMPGAPLSGGDVIDATVTLLNPPDPDDPDDLTEEKREEYRQFGRDARAAGLDRSDCPQVSGELCIEWVKGFEELCIEWVKGFEEVDANDAQGANGPGEGKAPAEGGEATGGPSSEAGEASGDDDESVTGSYEPLSDAEAKAWFDKGVAAAEAGTARRSAPRRNGNAARDAWRKGWDSIEGPL